MPQWGHSEVGLASYWGARAARYAKTCAWCSLLLVGSIYIQREAGVMGTALATTVLARAPVIMSAAEVVVIIPGSKCGYLAAVQICLRWGYGPPYVSMSMT